MNIVYTLLGIIAFIIFGISILIFFLIYYILFSFLPKQKAAVQAHKVSRIWARVLFTVFLIRFKVIGKEKIDPNKTYVFVANHQSQLDIPAYALSCKNTFRFLAKHELTKIPLMGYVIKNLYLTVKREDKEDRSKSLEELNNSIRNGISVFICPEGTRNRTQRPLLDFKNGAFKTAIENQVPVAALTIIGSKQRNAPANPLAFIPGTIYGIWSDPIETKGMTENDVETLKQTVYNQIINKLNRHV